MNILESYSDGNEEICNRVIELDGMDVIVLDMIDNKDLLIYRWDDEIGLEEEIILKDGWDREMIGCDYMSDVFGDDWKL